MKFGIAMFPTDYAIHPAPLAAEVERLGFDSLWFPEHTHIPTSRRTPWPGGAELPKEYSHTLDPFVAMASAAGATSNLLLGTGICLVIQRDPITLAKEVASVDHVSNGRLLFGIGGGWNIEEMENHGTDPRARWKRLRESIEAMKEIWTKDDAEYHGEFVDFDPVWSWPKPIQKPHPPVIVGGDGPNTLKRVVRYGDGWMPIPGRNQVPLDQRVSELRGMLEQAGRPMVPVTLFGMPARPEFIERFAPANPDRVVFFLPPTPEPEAKERLAQYAEVVKQYA